MIFPEEHEISFMNMDQKNKIARSDGLKAKIFSTLNGFSEEH